MVLAPVTPASRRREHGRHVTGKVEVDTLNQPVPVVDGERGLALRQAHDRSGQRALASLG
jgi:hypothetical protein